MGWARVAGSSATNSEATGYSFTTITVTPGANITAGNRMIVMVAASGNVVTLSISDASGNVWTADQTAGNLVIQATTVTIFSAPVTLGAGTKPLITITTNNGTPVNAFWICYAEYSGLSSGADVSQTNNTGVANSSAATTNATAPTAAANELCIAAYADPGYNCTVTPHQTSIFTLASNGFIQGDSDEFDSGAIGTQVATWTLGSNVNYVAAIAVYKLASEAGFFGFM